MFMLNALLIKDLSNKVDTNASDIQQIKNTGLYSTSEVKTNKVWTDGRPIYKKTIYIGSLPNSSEKTVAHGVSDLDFVTLIYGTSYNTSGRSFPLPATIVTISSGLASASIYVVADRNNIIVGTGIDRSSYQGYITIEYTKTTD